MSAEGAGEVLKGRVGRDDIGHPWKNSFSSQIVFRVAVLIVCQGHLALLVQLSSVSHAFSWGNPASVLVSVCPRIFKEPSCWMLCCVFYRA